MPIHCPKCGLSYDATHFSRGETIRCRCGSSLHIAMLETINDFLQYFDGEDEKAKANLIQKDAQLICSMILNEDCPDVDIEIAMGDLKEKVRQLFPDKIATYEMIYEARFKRLRSQFRSEN